MIEIDPKKLENKDLRHKIAKDIVAIRNLESISDKIKEKLIRYLIDKKSLTETTQSQESNEKEKIPEFEEDTFRIDSIGWKDEQEINLYDGGIIKVKVNPDGDIMEYLEGPCQGEQIFITYDAFVFEACKYKRCSRKTLEKRYLPTPPKLTLLAGNPGENSPQYNDFYNADIKNNQLSGYYIPRGNKIGNFNKRSCIWLAGGGDADFKSDKWNHDTGGKSYGFSGRLLKG
ncbi:MAG: hypothetical protein WAZ12_02735 [Candidatus Absconditicoccaceae bacterium]